MISELITIPSSVSCKEQADFISKVGLAVVIVLYM